jgi:excisionase family DNA binding protein
MQSSAVVQRSQSDLAAALAETTAVSRPASGGSIADGDAELAAPNHPPPQSRLRLHTPAEPDPRLAFTVNDTARILSVSRSTINKLIRLKALRTIKLLGKRLIPRASIEDVLRGDQ